MTLDLSLPNNNMESFRVLPSFLKLAHQARAFNLTLLQEASLCFTTLSHESLGILK